MEIKLSPLRNKPKDKITSIILCAGEGTRISDFVRSIPKPLIEINSKPILSYLISNLIKSNITSIIIITGHLKEEIEKFVASLKQKDKSLRNLISIINSGTKYKKGPLYSFLSITQDKSILNKDSIYLVLPGDTYFESDLFYEIINIIYKNLAFVKSNSIVFYQKLQGIVLKNTPNSNKLISAVKIEKKQKKEIVKEILKKKLITIDDKEHVKQIIPLFVFNYDLIKKILYLESKISAKTIREIINYIIKNKNILYAFPINSKYKFFDIDTKSDLTILNKKKKEKDNRRSDYSKCN